MHDFFSVSLQPFSAVFVVGKYAFHFRPEVGGVVHFQSVAKLVDDHIIYDFRRCEHQQTVKIQVASATAASPAGLLVSDRDSSVIYADLFRIKGNSLREPIRLQLIQQKRRLHL